MIGSRIVIAAPALPEMNRNNHLPSAAPGWLGEVIAPHARRVCMRLNVVMSDQLKEDQARWNDIRANWTL
jgi:hypothetical protein